MSECKWDSSKHGGKPCPVHGGGGNPGTGGHKIRINQGKYEARISDDADWEEVSPEEYADLREGGYQDFDETVDDDFGFDEETEDPELIANHLIMDPGEVTTEHYVNELNELRNTEGYNEQELIDKIAKNIRDGYGNKDSLQFAIDDYTKELYSGDKSEDEKPSETERKRISLDIPKYHTEPDENGGSNIVIDEGRFKGNRYADEADFSNTENANEEAFRDRLLKFMKDNGHDVDDKWFDEYPEESKQSMRDYFSDSDARKALMDEAEKPENKKKIIEKAKEMRPWYRNPIFSDEEIWKALSFDDIKKLLGK